ncbi:porin family protein [Urechidicola sp. KH5]
MKNALIYSFFLIICSNTASAQIFDFGIKGGLNYASNGDLITEAEEIIDNPDSNIGFHVGVYLKTKGRIYFRPELLYTQTSSTYKTSTNKVELNVDKLDMPLLLGFKLIGPIHIMGGPSLQYILDTDLEDVNLSDVEKDITVGGTIGLGLKLGNFGVDARYERGFTENEANFLGDEVSGRVDTRPSQFIVGASFKF